ncbi:MAG TPA: hypothetical protein DDW52_22830, partial [Planctomycetaceae bacterium]|nr:hypothetical protein [Planctomycetaceae bacterium]
MNKCIQIVSLCLLQALATASFACAQSRTPIATFLNLTARDASVRISALGEIETNWDVGETAMILESLRFSRDARTRATLREFLTRQTGTDEPKDLQAWYRWLWNQNVKLHPDYAEFKQKLYSRIDPSFAEYFSNDYDAS